MLEGWAEEEKPRNETKKEWRELGGKPGEEASPKSEKEKNQKFKKERIEGKSRFWEVKKMRTQKWLMGSRNKEAISYMGQKQFLWSGRAKSLK